jgi:hypothetical protein
MRFDLDGKQGEWFTFFQSEIKEDGTISYHEPEKGAGRVSLRVADAESIESIHSQTRKKVSEFVYNPKTRQMERVTYYDQTPEQEAKERQLLWDYAIVDWENLLDKNGKVIPVTSDNKLKLMNNPVFARFVGRCLQLITSSIDETKAVLEKN